jgi:hypothetical protein
MENMVKPIRKEWVVRKRLGNESVVYNQKTKSIHVLNKTSDFVWGLCDGNHTLEAIGRKIKNTFDVADDDQIKRDLEDILNQFERLGLIDILR